MQKKPTDWECNEIFCRIKIPVKYSTPRYIDINDCNMALTTACRHSYCTNKGSMAVSQELTAREQSEKPTHIHPYILNLQYCYIPWFYWHTVGIDIISEKLHSGCQVPRKNMNWFIQICLRVKKDMDFSTKFELM